MADVYDWKPDYSLYSPGGNDVSFASAYGNSEAANQATVDWGSLVKNGVSRFIDLEAQKRYAPNTMQPNNVGGNTAGQPALTVGNYLPWVLAGGAVLLGALFLAWRK